MSKVKSTKKGSKGSKPNTTEVSVGIVDSDSNEVSDVGDSLVSDDVVKLVSDDVVIIKGLPPQKLEVIYNVTVGIDVHKTNLVVCVSWPDKCEVRTYPNMKCHSKQLAIWLNECGVEFVVMESTGIFWRSPFDILRNNGVNVVIVNPKHLNREKGHKTDIEDACWLATLAKLNNVLKSSRIPAKNIEELRARCRNRQKFMEDQTNWKNRILKSLTSSGFGVSQVVTDPFGKTGRAIIDGLTLDLSPMTILMLIEDQMGYRIKASKDKLV
ncbi:MAG: transposase [Deltaproteobacteria bacterium]|jgi:hypothetical protein|nr:transposase [Deltaproteobacteria bacterium]